MRQSSFLEDLTSSFTARPINYGCIIEVYQAHAPNSPQLLTFEQMASNDKVTLQNIQDYANKYFPDEFAKLPLAENLVWVPASQTRTRRQSFMKIALTKLRIGGYTGNQSIWTHKELNQSPGGV